MCEIFRVGFERRLEPEVIINYRRNYKPFDDDLNIPRARLALFCY